jgi:gas vesicle protein GvpL/GvpF
MPEGALGSYVYCVLGADSDLAPAGVRGVDPQHPLRAVGHAGLAAVTSSVPLAEFGAEALKRNLNDMQWLERTARAHQTVLDRVRAAGTPVPLRLCTVFGDDAGVRAMLDRERDALARALARLAGREEWGVKLIGDPRALRGAGRERADTAAPADAQGSGHAYLARLRHKRVAREQAQGIVREAVRSVHLGLRAHAAAARVLKAPSRELSGETGELVLNGAYLVDSDRAAEFRALAAELGEGHRVRGLRLEVTGPWPPYSFVADPADERAPSGTGGK